MGVFTLWLLIGIIATTIFEWILKSSKNLKEKFWNNHISIFGYHFHHSFVGLVLFTIGLLLLLLKKDEGIPLIGIGLGMILIHTYTDKKLVFFEKDRKKSK